MIVEKHIVIEGNHQLNGEIKVKGAKNAVLKQMVLPILSEGEYTLTNVPNITDVLYMQEVLEHMPFLLMLWQLSDPKD